MPVPHLPRPLAFVTAAVAFMAVMAAAGAPSVMLNAYQHAWGFPESMLTTAFAIYALVLLVALPVCGALADRVGRRPVALAALLLSAVAMVQFLAAHGIGAVIAARAVQGAATAASTTVFSAWIVELASARTRRVGEVLVSITTAGGLGIGVVLAGAATQFTVRPNAAVFGAALALILAAALLLAAAPETLPAASGTASQSPVTLLPRPKVPAAVRARFLRLAPGLIGIWMSAGLILGLGASLTTSTLHLGGGLLGSVVVALQPLTATVVTIVLAPRFAPGRLIPAGLVAVIVGVAAEGVSFLTGSPVLVIVGAVVTGVGFGSVFSGTLRDLLPGVPAQERAEFFAAFYAVGYLAYGLSAILSGLLSDVIGLRPAATIHAAATVALSVVAFVLLVAGSAVGREARRRPAVLGYSQHER